MGVNPLLKLNSQDYRLRGETQIVWWFTFDLFWTMKNNPHAISFKCLFILCFLVIVSLPRIPFLEGKAYGVRWSSLRFTTTWFFEIKLDSSKRKTWLLRNVNLILWNANLILRNVNLILWNVNLILWNETYGGQSLSRQSIFLHGKIILARAKSIPLAAKSFLWDCGLRNEPGIKSRQGVNGECRLQTRGKMKTGW